MNLRILVVTLIFGAVAWGQQSGIGKAYISIPGVSGSLELDAGPARWESRVRPDGKETQLRSMNRPDGLVITAFLQKVDFDGSAEKCREEWWPATEKGSREHGWKIDHLEKSSQGSIALVAYLILEYKGMPVRQKSVHAYLGGRDLCAEIHLSKVQFAQQDQKLFDQVLATIQLRTDDSAAPEKAQSSQASEYFGQGSRFYMQHNYPAAAERYQKALDLERQKRTLTPTTFRVLIDNLGMSYGISGDLAKAKETFAYGIAQDPEYPLFYYNMACTYGEMGKMDESLEQLRLAFKYKANMIAGESFPDPMTDDSFRSFVHDQKFINAVQEMQHP